MFVMHGCITMEAHTDLKNNLKWMAGGSLMAAAIVGICIIQTCNLTKAQETKQEAWRLE